LFTKVEEVPEIKRILLNKDKLVPKTATLKQTFFNPIPSAKSTV